MVTFYGAGQRTGILAVEGKLAKVLGKQEGTLVVRAAERDAVVAEISARMARYEKYDTDLYDQLKKLRRDVQDVFNKGLDPGSHIIEQLYFLDDKTRGFVEKMSNNYVNVVTPDDFKKIAGIMSENLASQTPILKDFTKFFGRLAEDYMTLAKPKESSLDFTSYLKTELLGAKRRGDKLPTWLNQILGIKDESIRDKLLNRIPGYVPDGMLESVITGVKAPEYRRTGFKVGKFDIYSEDITPGFEVGIANKLPKKWTSLPWVNFDGKTLEQNFTQVFEEKLMYKDKDGKWVTNILQIPQKTDPTPWEEFRNKDGKINDIADVGQARTAYGVNGECDCRFKIS